MVREARRLVAGVNSAPFEWCAWSFPRNGSPPRSRRPETSRPSGAPIRPRSGAGCLADIGTHAFHLAEFVSGPRCEALAAQVASFVPGRRVEDYADVLLRFQGGAHGALWVSQVAIGHANGLSIRLYGERGSLGWSVADANALEVASIGEPPHRIERAGPGTRFQVGFPGASGRLRGGARAALRRHSGSGRRPLRRRSSTTFCASAAKRGGWRPGTSVH